jgi:uncharacterized protein DUF4244
VTKCILEIYVRTLGGFDVQARARCDRERGQATTEYVLVLLGVAAIAIAVVAWATSSGKVGELLDRVFDHIAGQVS